MIDLVKLFKYVLKHVWLPIICAVIGFVGVYFYMGSRTTVTYTASGTMYVYNGNPNLVNYQYANINDLDSAVKLINTYMVVVRSNKVMDVVAERLAGDYPGITPIYISGTLFMSPVDETGVVRVGARTSEAQMSADICNTVLDVAPQEIIKVVGAGGIEIIDYAGVPEVPDHKSSMRNSIMAGGAAGFLACGILVLLFLFNRKITDASGLTNYYTPPVLAQIEQRKKNKKNAEDVLLTDGSPEEMLESYSKLRVNLLYLLAGKKSHTVVVTSAVPGEGNPVIAANLAVSCVKGGKKVLLIDGDVRKGCLCDVLGYDSHMKGLSDILAKTCTWQEAVVKNMKESLDVLPSGSIAPNSTGLLGTDSMAGVLGELEKAYDLIIMVMPPVNAVADALEVSAHVAGCLLAVCQNYSDHREIRKALIAAEMTGMEVMGFVFSGKKIDQAGALKKKYYKGYYGRQDRR